MLAGLAEVVGALAPPVGSFDVSELLEVVGAPTIAPGSEEESPTADAGATVAPEAPPLIESPVFATAKPKWGPLFVGLRMSLAVMASDGGVRLGMPDCAASEKSGPVFRMLSGPASIEFL